MKAEGITKRTVRFFALLLGVAGLGAWHIPARATSIRCDRLFENIGPTVRIELPGARRDPNGQKLKRLKIGHYSLNAFDLVKNGISRLGFQDNDSAIAVINFERPDILTLSEVMNQETLTELSRRLNGAYESILIEGNDSNSLAVLFRKSLPLVIEIESHRSVRHDYFGNDVPLFTRDLLTIHLSRPGEKQTLISLGVGHFKARKNRSTQDPFFATKRRAEEKGALEILEAASSRRSSRARVFLGDMNSDVRAPTEMTEFKAAGYRDALDILGIPNERRASHSHFPKVGEASFWQVDAAFVSPEIEFRQALLGGYIAADRTARGQSLPPPGTIEELRTRGSDHKMILIEIDLTQLR